MLGYRHSVSGEADYKTELQARWYGFIWEYCCRLMVHCDASANEAAINIGGPSFSKEWLEVNQKEEVSSIEFGSDVAEEFSCSSVSVVRAMCRHHLAPRSTFKGTPWAPLPSQNLERGWLASSYFFFYAGKGGTPRAPLPSQNLERSWLGSSFFLCSR